MTWEELSRQADEKGALVRELKASGDKEALDGALKALLAVKEELRSALEAAIAAETDPVKVEELKAKLPPAPKSKAEKKKESKDSEAAAANKKAAEEAKAAARAKKKAAEAAEKKAAPAAEKKAAPAEEKKAAAVEEKGAPAAAPKAKPAAAANDAPAAAKALEHKSVALNKTLEVLFVKEHPPLLALLAARLAKTEVVLKRVEGAQLPHAATAVLLLPMGKGKLIGEGAIARYLARTALPAPSLLYAPSSDPFAVSEVDQWVEYAPKLLSASQPLAAALAVLDKALRMRAFFAGHSITIADGAVWIALRSHPNADKQISAATPHLLRWWKHVDALGPMATVAQDFFGIQRDAGSLEIPLPGAEMGKVVTRFPPEPSGHLHIGHVKAALLNAHFAERYEGKLLLRFDDTNPSKEKEEYEHAIIEDLKRLEIRPHKVSHTSDHFQAIMDIQTKMIEDGLAFVDPSTQEEQKALRLKKLPSPYRDQSVEENLRLWKEMQLGSEEGVKCCVRAKICYDSDNGAMRDPTTYRCNAIPHAQTKDKFKCYPTYDLACPIVDSLEGVTHALRDRQYSDRDHQYRWFLENLKLRDVQLWGFSRINFVRTLLSKRKLQWLVDQGRVEGWDDARFPTVAGVLRRGMTVQGLKTFILNMGASKSSCLMEWSKIWATNKNEIDLKAARYTCLLKDGLVTCHLTGAPPEPFALSINLHPKDETLGRKIRFFSDSVLLQADDAAGLQVGEEVTLMSWGNVIISEVVKDVEGNVTSVHARLHLAGSVKSTKKKFTWLAQTPELTDLTLVDFDFLLNKDKVDEDDNIEDLLTPVTRFDFAAKGEPSLRQLKKGEIIQVERRGFYICERPYIRASDPIVLYFVPDGKNMFGVKRG